MPEDIGIQSRLRAGLAWSLAGLAALFRRAERWTQRGMRGTVVAVLAVALILVGIVGLVRETRATGHWVSRQFAGLVHDTPPGGAGAAKPHGKPEGRAGRGPEDGPGRGRDERRGPPAPPPPAPPAPPR